MRIVKLAEQLEIKVREGSKHPFILMYDGIRPCPVAESTHARKMLVPWFKSITGYDTQLIYSSLKSGELYRG